MHSRILGVLAVASLALAACSGASTEPASPASTMPADDAPSASSSSSAPASPASPPASPTSSPSPTKEIRHATKATLLTMEIPKECPDNGGKRLQGGELEDASTRARAQVATDSAYFHDFDGDGADDALTVFTCHGGGVPWPDQLVLVAPDGSLMDSIMVTELFAGSDKGSVQKIEPKGDKLRITADVREGNFGSSTRTGTLTAPGGKLQFIADKRKDPFDGAKFSSMGYGPLGLGMSAEEILRRNWGELQGDEMCEYVVPGPLLRKHGIDFAVQPDDVLFRVNATTETARTPSGIHVGSSVAELEKAYGAELRRGDNPYPYYLAFADRAMTFSVEGGKVTGMAIHNHDAKYLWDVGGEC